MEILAAEHLSFTYPLCDTPAVSDLSFSVGRGEFVAVCGATGSGKSTLLRLLKRELSPMGKKTGTVMINSRPIDELSPEFSACAVGFVMQKPEQQIVTDKVWHELAFGLENMNVPQQVIARRVAETASYFGIEDWFHKKVSELSGGQKQILNLASVMVMNPEILILDEPTAQLDPIAAADFIATLKKLNRELSLTVIMTEHRLEEVVPVCDRLLVLERGELLAFDHPTQVIPLLKNKPALLQAMPAASRLFHGVNGIGDCPLDVCQGRRYIEEHFSNHIQSVEAKAYHHSHKPALEFSNVYFRYERHLPDVLKDLSFTVYEGEVFCILGGNGSGKTTTLSAAAHLLLPYSGTVRVFGKKLKEYKNQSLYRECLTLLPQDVQTVFLKNTVEEELADAQACVPDFTFDLRPLYHKHPYDLSGGEQQLVALAKALATSPKLLLLDEPTKGLDAGAKLGLIEIIGQLKKKGITVVMVTHDVEFAAACADRCALFFNGQLVSQGAADEFFCENNFYTTAANRMTRGYFTGVVTVEDGVALCLQNGVKEGIET